MAMDSNVANQLNEISDQLCHAVDHDFNFSLKVSSPDITFQKLGMLINFVLDAAQRSLTEIKSQRESATQQFEEAHAERSQKNAILDNTPNPIITVDSSGRIITANPATTIILGYPQDHLCGMNIQHLFSRVEFNFAEWVKQNDADGFRKELNAIGNNRVVSVEVSIKLFKVENEQHAIMVMRDLTELKEKEKRLAVIQEEYTVAARQAGQAEIASEILHNVGNILNSVNISTAAIKDTIRGLKLNLMEKMVELLKQHETIFQVPSLPDTIQKMPSNLEKLYDYFLAQQEQVLTEVNKLQENVEHIKSIVATQQQYAKKVAMTEMISVNTLLDDLIKLQSRTFHKHNIIFRKKYGDIEHIAMDKHKLMMILMNVLINAKDALKEKKESERIIEVSTSQAMTWMAW